LKEKSEKEQSKMIGPDLGRHVSECVSAFVCVKELVIRERKCVCDYVCAKEL